MRKMKLRILNLTLLAILLGGLFLLQKQVFAAVRCETQYGGGEVCVRTGKLQVNKKIRNPKDGSFVDNLGLGDYKFAPGEEIAFKLFIKNVGDATFSKVEVKDTLPEYLEKASGELSFEISNLTVGETEEREFKAKVVSSEKFPGDKTTLCVVNTAEVWSGDERDKDTAQVCLEKKVLGVTPVTGPENGLAILAFSLLAGIAGVSFLKFSKKLLLVKAGVGSVSLADRTPVLTPRQARGKP